MRHYRRRSSLQHTDSQRAYAVERVHASSKVDGRKDVQDRTYLQSYLTYAKPTNGISMRDSERSRYSLKLICGHRLKKGCDG